jgi:hypothetical protein
MDDEARTGDDTAEAYAAAMRYVRLAVVLGVVSLVLLLVLFVLLG